MLGALILAAIQCNIIRLPKDKVGCEYFSLENPWSRGIFGNRKIGIVWKRAFGMHVYQSLQSANARASSDTNS